MIPLAGYVSEVLQFHSKDQDYHLRLVWVLGANTRTEEPELTEDERLSLAKEIVIAFLLKAAAPGVVKVLEVQQKQRRKIRKLKAKLGIGSRKRKKR